MVYKLKLKFSFLLLFFALELLSQSKQAYVLYNKNGKKMKYEKMISNIKNQDVVFIGESHNNPISHWIEYEITSDLGKINRLILGAEMFEADNQTPLTQYITSEINEKQLDSSARLWKNYYTDYAPLVEIAKKNYFPFIATNIPRRYASQVAKFGLESLDTLPANIKEWIAPLPIEYDPELPCYKNMLQMMPGHAGPNLPKAQAIKDATMAYFISGHIRKGTQFIHYNGSYHSEQRQGIL